MWCLEMLLFKAAVSLAVDGPHHSELHETIRGNVDPVGTLLHRVQPSCFFVCFLNAVLSPF